MTAENSYPFAAANAFGGSDMVSQDQWQKMAHLAGDRIDAHLTASTYSADTLPFGFKILNGRDVLISPGRAVVGGFTYELTTSLAVTIDPNLADKGRRDTIVIRADLTKGSVNLVAVKGQPSASPIAPLPQRVLGHVWEMVLYEVDAPAANGAITVFDRLQFDLPPRIASPWLTRDTASSLEIGSFIYDLDADGGDTQYEAFKGRDGYMITRHLGRVREYTPTLGGVNFQPGPEDRVCRWRWVAPNLVHFNMRITNRTATDITLGAWYMTLTLPQPANGKTAQTYEGYLDNPQGNGNSPWLTSIKGVTWEGNSTSVMNLFMPSQVAVREGLVTFTRIPARTSLHISGTYESDIFNE